MINVRDLAECGCNFFMFNGEPVHEQSCPYYDDTALSIPDLGCMDMYEPERWYEDIDVEEIDVVDDYVDSAPVREKTKRMRAVEE